MLPRLICFADTAQMVTRLADLGENVLRAAIAERGSATLIVSGGSTPKPLYQTLAGRSIDWSCTQLILADERWVPPSDAGSNEAFIRDAFAEALSDGAQFTGFWEAGMSSPEAAQRAADRLISVHRPFNFAVLGMGEDGHTASWFPDADGLTDALADTDKAPLVSAVVAKESPVTGKYTTRLTLTMRALADVSIPVLLLKGPAKREAYEAICANPDPERYPVVAFLKRLPDCWVCWAEH